MDVLLWQPEQSPGQQWLGSRGNTMLCLLPLCQVRDTQQGSVQYWHWQEEQLEAAARQDKLGNESSEKIDRALLSKCAMEIDGL